MNISELLLQYTQKLDEVVGDRLDEVLKHSSTVDSILAALSSITVQLPRINSWVRRAAELQRDACRVRVFHEVLENVIWFRNFQNRILLTGTLPEQTESRILLNTALSDQNIVVTNALSFFDRHRPLHLLYEEIVVKDERPRLLREVTFFDGATEWRPE